MLNSIITKRPKGRLQLWTDGASNVHNKTVLPGGWAYAFVQDRMMLCTGWDGEAPTTNQRMELMGVIMGLEQRLHRTELESIQYDEIEIVTDSAYVLRGMTEKWYVDWRFNNWLKKDENGDWIPVKNSDLWKRLITAELDTKNDGVYVIWTKVKGHSGLEFNNLVDKLAVMGKKKVS